MTFVCVAPLAACIPPCFINLASLILSTVFSTAHHLHQPTLLLCLVSFVFTHVSPTPIHVPSCLHSSFSSHLVFEILQGTTPEPAYLPSMPHQVHPPVVDLRQNNFNHLFMPLCLSGPSTFPFISFCIVWFIFTSLPSSLLHQIRYSLLVCAFLYSPINLFSCLTHFAVLYLSMCFAFSSLPPTLHHHIYCFLLGCHMYFFTVSPLHQSISRLFSSALQLFFSVYLICLILSNLPPSSLYRTCYFQSSMYSSLMYARLVAQW